MHELIGWSDRRFGDSTQRNSGVVHDHHIYHTLARYYLTLQQVTTGYATYGVLLSSVYAPPVLSPDADFPIQAFFVPFNYMTQPLCSGKTRTKSTNIMTII